MAVTTPPVQPPVGRTLPLKDAPTGYNNSAVMIQIFNPELSETQAQDPLQRIEAQKAQGEAVKAKAMKSEDSFTPSAKQGSASEVPQPDGKDTVSFKSKASQAEGTEGVGTEDGKAVKDLMGSYQDALKSYQDAEMKRIAYLAKVAELKQGQPEAPAATTTAIPQQAAYGSVVTPEVPAPQQGTMPQGMPQAPQGQDVAVTTSPQQTPPASQPQGAVQGGQPAVERPFANAAPDQLDAVLGQSPLEQPQQVFDALKEVYLTRNSTPNTSGILTNIVKTDTTKLDPTKRMDVDLIRQLALINMAALAKQAGDAQPQATVPVTGLIGNILNSKTESPMMLDASVQALRIINKPQDATLKQLLTQASKLKGDDPVLQSIRDSANLGLQGQGLQLPEPITSQQSMPQQPVSQQAPVVAKA
ncbi:MAG: hypothetical protein ACKO37_06825 [Vampirovibrionales bacterium]